MVFRVSSAEYLGGENWKHIAEENKNPVFDVAMYHKPMNHAGNKDIHK